MVAALFGRRRRRHYWKRLRSDKRRVAALLVALGFALAIGATHLATATPVLEPEASAAASSQSQHDIRSQSPLIAAFAATFGSPYGALKRVGARNEATWFTPGTLVDAPVGPVLISQGDVIAHDVDSTGKLAIIYLEPRDRAPRRVFLPAIETSSSGQIYGWRVRRDLGPDPIVEVEGRATLADRTCAWTTWLELAPAGPRERSLDAADGARMGSC